VPQSGSLALQNPYLQPPHSVQYPPTPPTHRTHSTLSTHSNCTRCRHSSGILSVTLGKMSGLTTPPTITIPSPETSTTRDPSSQASRHQGRGGSLLWRAAHGSHLPGAPVRPPGAQAQLAQLAQEGRDREVEERDECLDSPGVPTTKSRRRRTTRAGRGEMSPRSHAVRGTWGLYSTVLYYAVLYCTVLSVCTSHQAPLPLLRQSASLPRGLAESRHGLQLVLFFP